MSKRFITILLIAVFVVVMTSYGATLFTGKFDLEVYHNGERVWTKNYKIKTSTLMTVLFKYGGDFHKFYLNNKEQQKVRDFSCINDEIERDLYKLKNHIEKPMINSQIIWDEAKAEFIFKEGKNGLLVNQNELIDSLYKNFKAKTTVTLPVNEIEQKVTIDQLKKQAYERGAFSTNYNSSKSNRKHNIELAVQKLNGQKIPAKAQLSFNKIVGPRTIANGFKAAGIISGGTFVQGVGGGVCQVSTTLFNAWVRAGLDVINAVNHSLPVSYIGPSFDAMVSSKNDLLLYNNTPHDVYLKAITKDNNIYITVYGIYTEETIVLRNQVIRTIPCDEYDIIDVDIDWAENENFRILKKPKNGLVSVAYRDVYVNGKRVQSEKFRTNTYAPQKGKMVRKPVISEEEAERQNQLLKPSYLPLFTMVPSLVSFRE